jgi:hypothetical protein
MPADQAAGLRRRNAQLPVTGIHCFSETPTLTTQLAVSLHRHGRTTLLVDMRGRLFADAPGRSLFGWEQQLARSQLSTVPQAYGDGWYAPGLRADAPGLARAIQDYDGVVFDAGPIGNPAAQCPESAHALVLEIPPMAAATQHAYRMLKTVSYAGNSLRIALLGDAATCDHVMMTCARFLGQAFTQAIDNLAHEDDALTAVAVRMADEETLRMMRCK